VFLTDPLTVDQFTYRCWLQGYDEEETASRRHALQGTQTIKNLYGLLLDETHDQFRNFRLIEHNIKYPSDVGSHIIFQLSPSLQRMMIESYYDLDDGLLRELAGKKLMNSLRRDLDEVADNLRMKLACCWRQFDNLRRIYKKVVSDTKKPACETIEKNFLLSKELARKYTRIVFLSFHRLDTSKKRLQFLVYSDFDKFASVLMAYWGDPNTPESIEIDAKLKDDVRDLKAYLFSSKDITEKYKKAVKGRFSTATPSMMKDKQKQLDGKFKSILKAIVNIGANVSDSKEFKDIFEDMVEKIGDTCKRMDMSVAEMDQLFLFLGDTFESHLVEILSLRHAPRFANNWRRYLEGLRCILIHMYPLMT